MHGLLLREHGGAEGLRDPGALDGALAHAEQAAAHGETRLHVLAAKYGHGLARSHPFMDGNKRIALAAIAVFLELNDHELTATQVDAAATILALAAGELHEAGLAAWVEADVRPSEGA